MPILLLLAACSPSGPSDGAAPRQPGEPTATASIEAEGLQGEWRLVEMNGRPAPLEQDPQDANHPITMTVGDFSFRARSQCVAFWRRYQRDGERLRVTPDNPGAMCARGLSHWETEFERSLSATDRATRTGDRLVLEGAGSRLVFSALPPVAPTAITGRWRLSRLQGEATSADAPLEITIGDGRPSRRTPASSPAGATARTDPCWS